MAVLRLVHGDALEVVRTRDAEVQASCDLRVDVGGRSDPATGDFDHHQRGGAGERANGVRFASFGLVWRAFGPGLCGGDEEAAAAIDERLVQGVDANDTGQRLVGEPLVEGHRGPMTASGLVASMNGSWDEGLTPEQEDERFDGAVAWAADVLRRELAGSAAYGRARDLVRAALAARTDPRVVELPRNLPWREIVVREAPDALFVTYEKRDGWALNAVPRELGRFENRLDLPEAWAGLSDEALAEVTGVPDALFAHAARFYASARSREGVLALARLALAGQ